MLTKTRNIPYENLNEIKGRIGITEGEWSLLAPWRDTLAAKSDLFARYFFDVFYEIPETRIFLEGEKGDNLKSAWARWFALFFTSMLDPPFLGYLWQVGMRHVEVNLDQRFSNLGFSVVRQFCHRIISEEIPREEALSVTMAVDKLIDLCVLIETDAYIETATRCNVAVIKEVADRLRNPATVIGGNIKRLQKRVDPGSKEFGVYKMLIAESERLDKMVGDSRVYMEVFENEPVLERVALGDAIDGALSRLLVEESGGTALVERRLDTRIPYITADRKTMGYFFYYVFQNCLEALDGDDQCVVVSSSYEDAGQKGVRVEIFNTGVVADAVDVDKLMTPFYTTKTTGTGFGLPIAALVAKRHSGTFAVEPVEGKGVRIVLILPLKNIV